MDAPRKFFKAALAAGLFLTFLIPPAAQAAPGDRDPTFGNGGIAAVDLGGYDDGHFLALQPDGKVVLLGEAAVPGAVAFGLARLNADGSLDTSFGNGGAALVNRFGYSVNLAGIALQPDGKIVVGGWASATANGTNFDLWIMRFQSDGTFDPGFGNAGLVTTDLASSLDIMDALAIQADGRILAGGWVRKPNDDADFFLVRYLPDGQLDPQFGQGGKVFTDVTGQDDAVEGIALQPDGKILVTGFAVSREYTLARYDSHGNLDPGFGKGGIASPDQFTLSAVPQTIALQPDGKILAGGIAFTGTDGDFIVWRFLADGRPDPGFGTGGKVLTDFSGHYDIVQALSIQADGGIVAAGFARTSNDYESSDLALVRYQSNGTLDPAFGDNGRVVDDIFGSADLGSDIAGLPDGRLLVTGQILGAPETPWNARILRYLGPEIAVNQPPVIQGAAASPDTLWPANHKMVDVSIPYTVTDDRDPALAVRCSLSVASNEPVNGTGDGDTGPDWQILAKHHIRLRAERAGNGNGRIYTITITCQDSAGAASTQKVTVRVPKNQEKK